MEVRMKNSSYLFCILFLALGEMGECNPKCYICDSMSNTDCIQPKDHKMDAKECTPNNVGEMKVAVEKLKIKQLANFFGMEIDRNDFTAPLQCVKTVIKVSCIKCYQCRSDDESNCDKLEEDSEYLGDCNDSRHSVYCRKIFQKLSFPDYNVLTIIRECAYVHKSATSCYKSPWKDNNVITCECETDGCNKGYSVLRTFPTWIVFLLDTTRRFNAGRMLQLNFRLFLHSARYGIGNTGRFTELFGHMAKTFTNSIITSDGVPTKSVKKSFYFLTAFGDDNSRDMELETTENDH
ncbi:hypothetical protein FQR65_LT01433 [Abscondita terminalis]|nr:hypothetical protein FQR65_LT01433 [Abscondita terminalis]